jgi:putative transcriptional regulator
MTNKVVKQTKIIVTRRRYMTLKNRLKERRAALNVNQQEMGRLCGVSRQTISLIERGDYSPSVTLALTIAKVCGVTVEDVFYLQEEDEDEDGEK